MPNIKPVNKRPKDENGQAHGEWTEYYSNGQLYYRWNYFHGMVHGLNEGYYEDGTLVYRGYWNMNRRFGYWYVFNYRQKLYYLRLI